MLARENQKDVLELPHAQWSAINGSAHLTNVSGEIVNNEKRRGPGILAVIDFDVLHPSIESLQQSQESAKKFTAGNSYKNSNHTYEFDTYLRQNQG